MMIHHLKLSLGCSLIYLFAFAIGSAKQPEQVQLQFVSFPIMQNPPPVELISGNGKSIEIHLPSKRLSDTYTVDRQANWQIGKIELNEDKQPVFNKYGQTKSLPSNKQIILVLCKGDNYADGLELITFDAAKKGFNGGDYLIFNGSTVDIAGKLGKSRFKTKPRQHIMLEAKPNREARGRQYLDTTLFFKKGEKAQPFYSAPWRFSDKARVILFVYHEPHTQRLARLTIKDHVMP